MRGREVGDASTKICGKTLARVLKHQMPAICRTQGCPEKALEQLGHCAVCYARYWRDRGDGRRLVAAARRERWELFSCLEEPEARRFAEHLVGHARLGRRSVMWAIADFVAETRETQFPAAGDAVSACRRLRLIPGGAA
jgi:hypothetical protein